jgi:CubicO group peptidase (beta-lactamase class C family)
MSRVLRHFTRRSSLIFLALSFSVAVFATGASAADSNQWPTATPEEMGVDSAALVEMFDFVRTNGTRVHSVQLARKGKLVLDAYFYPYREEMRHDVASVTKSITSTLVGLAIDKGHLPDVRQPLLALFTERPVASVDARKSKLTVEDLLTMRAGWDCGYEPKEGRLMEMRRTGDWIQFMLDLPMIAEPGERWAYCSGNCHVLSVLITRKAGTNALAFARRELFEPLGIRDEAWPSDPKGNNYGWGDLQLHPRDMAKIGQLFLQRGRWGERQVISEKWIGEATRPHVEKTIGTDQYGYFWWMPGPKYPGVFEAIGRGGQRITVWPAKELVLVYTGGGFNNDHLTPFILKALRSNTPLPSNPSALAKLREHLAAARKAPAPQPVPKVPPLAARISGRKYALASNSLEFAALTLQFGKPDEATLRFTRLGQNFQCGVGLDNVLRFSTDKLIDLPFACKGRWLDDETFFLELDRVAGVSCYQFTLHFADHGGSMNVALRERTGLLEEVFQGTSAP